MESEKDKELNDKISSLEIVLDEEFSFILNDKIFWLEDRIEKLEKTIIELDNKLFDLKNYVDNLSLSSFTEE